MSADASTAAGRRWLDENLRPARAGTPSVMAPQAVSQATPDLAVRNVSDPEVDSSNPDAGKLANYIYEHFGRWSSICSAIVCWTIVCEISA